jgi:hypothetical protein
MSTIISISPIRPFRLKKGVEVYRDLGMPTRDFADENPTLLENTLLPIEWENSIRCVALEKRNFDFPIIKSSEL